MVLVVIVVVMVALVLIFVAVVHDVADASIGAVAWNA